MINYFECGIVYSIILLKTVDIKLSLKIEGVLKVKKCLEKAYLITDNDLDGVSAAIVTSIVCPEMKYFIPSERREIEEELQRVLLSEEYEWIIMTDCSPQEEYTIQLINDFVAKGNEFTLLDHHRSALSLNQYDWAHVVVDDEGVKQCGAQLFTKYLKNEGVDTSKVDGFIECVRQYDTWDWVETGYTLANELNTLLAYYGIGRFIKVMIKRILDNKIDFFCAQRFLKVEDKLILQVISGVEERYLIERMKTVKVIEFCGHQVGLVFADQLTNDLGTAICEKYSTVDFAMIVDFGRSKVSLRSRGGSIDLSKIAEQNGGGGHASAAGFYFDSGQVEKSFLDILKK